jgi:cation diffusion facilitator CzcD-associated flavoprotein CzcO
VGAVELFDYFKGRAKANGVDNFVRLNHRVKAAVWNDSAGVWEVEVEDSASGSVFTDRAEVLINAAGFLK